MSKSDPLYSYVIPVYNEEKNISLIYDKIVNIMNPVSDNYEIIFTNDGSKDNSYTELKKIAVNDDKIKVINLSRNFGHQAALTAGLKYAKGDAVISMDCDLQDPPEVVAEMINKWHEGFDIVYARRSKRKDNFFKKYSALFYYKLLRKFSDVDIPRNVGDFRLTSKKVLDVLNSMPEKARYLRGMVAWVGFKYTFVDFERPERIHGETNYTLTKMVRLAMDGIFNFSLLPLKFGFVLGGISIFTGTAFLIYMIFDILINNTRYELYKFLTVTLFIFTGFQFILMWLLGEYIGRIYDENKNRPLFVIDEKINID